MLLLQEEKVINEIKECPFKTDKAIARKLKMPVDEVRYIIENSNIDVDELRLRQYIKCLVERDRFKKNYYQLIAEFLDTDDMLQDMFNLQKKMQKRINNDNLPEMKPNRIPMTVTSIIAELGEILESQQAWKDWKENPEEPDINHLKMEVADLWHFVINLTLFLNMDAEDVFNEFVDKNKVNHKRQDNNY